MFYTANFVTFINNYIGITLWTSFFSKLHYFSENQFGFIKGRSTALYLLRIVDEWTSQLDSIIVKKT